MRQPQHLVPHIRLSMLQHQSLVGDILAILLHCLELFARPDVVFGGIPHEGAECHVLALRPLVPPVVHGGRDHEADLL
jgi:hypothetical protein